MPRRTFVYDKKSDKMVEVHRDHVELAVHYANGDFKAFVSPIDGTVVEGRKAYQEHLKKHNVVPFEQGSEKVTTTKPDPTPRRELIWELVDRSIQRKGEHRG